MEVLGNENVPPADTESDEEDQPMATNFRARPVPEHTNQPVFQNMVREQPKRYEEENTQVCGLSPTVRVPCNSDI